MTWCPKHYVYLLGAGVLVLLLGLGLWYGLTRKLPPPQQQGRKILYYVDPMNPSHTSPEPGIAPCGMKMEPVYADEAETPADQKLAPGAVRITPEKQQLTGIRAAKVEKTPWTHTLRTFGRVAVDERRVYRLTAFTEGWAVQVNPYTTGSLVRRHEPLATIYSKDLFTALQTYYYALYSVENLGQNTGSQVEALQAQKRLAEFNLFNLGLSRAQLLELAKNKKLTQEVELRAPATSFVLARNLTPGQKFNPADELYRLADLNRVLVLADIYDYELNLIHPGQAATVKLASRSRQYQTAVSEVLPEFNPTSLTFRVRLELDNQDFILLPGMFTEVEFVIQLPEGMHLPADAVLDSGARQTVFVDRGQGFFEPRQVKIAWRLGDRVGIASGLEPGEAVVVSGNFLLDSESRMKLAAAGMFGKVVQDPVCGLNVDASRAQAASLVSEYQGTAYYFCSAECRQHFVSHPGRYAGPVGGQAVKSPEGPEPQTEVGGTVIDPVCGEVVDPKVAQARGWTSDYAGKTYYFSSYACNRAFDKNPEAYRQQVAAMADGDKCLVCGLPVSPTRAKEAGLVSEYQGRTYYLDTPGCKARFDLSPPFYLGQEEEGELYQRNLRAPTDPNLLLRLRRDFLRSLPVIRSLEPPPDKPPAAAPESQSESEPAAATAAPSPAAPSTPEQQAPGTAP